MRAVIFFLSILLLSGASHACPDVYLKQKLEFQRALDRHDTIIFGETHGTMQSPEAFFEFVCWAASHTERKIIVGLELPPGAVEIAMRSIALGDSPKILSQSKFWVNARDGRTSVANYRLLQRLANLSLSQKIEIVGFDGRVTGKENFGREAFEIISQARTYRATKTGTLPLTILLAGAGHANVDDTTHSLGRPFRIAGSRVMVLAFGHAGGNAWVCRAGTCGKAEVSGYSKCTAPSEEVVIGLVGTSMVCLGALEHSPPAFEGGCLLCVPGQKPGH